MITKKILVALISYITVIGITAMACIILFVYAIPHLPISDKYSFPFLLREQMVLDHEQEG